MEEIIRQNYYHSIYLMLNKMEEKKEKKKKKKKNQKKPKEIENLLLQCLYHQNHQVTHLDL